MNIATVSSIRKQLNRVISRVGTIENPTIDLLREKKSIYPLEHWARVRAQLINTVVDSGF